MQEVWKLWFSDVFLAVILVGWLTGTAYEFRIKTRRRWLSTSLFVLGYSLCVVGAVANEWISRQSDSFLHILKNPGPPSHLEPDWGKNFSAEERLRYSQMLARSSFESWGMRTKYFDLDGNLRVYEPTQDDKDHREVRLALINQTERIAGLCSYAAIAWLFLPLIAIGISLVWPSHKSGALTPAGFARYGRQVMRGVSCLGVHHACVKHHGLLQRPVDNPTMADVGLRWCLWYRIANVRDSPQGRGTQVAV